MAVEEETSNRPKIVQSGNAGIVSHDFDCYRSGTGNII